MQLSKNFTLSELCHSNTADAKGYNNLTDDTLIISNLRALCVNVLQPLREAYGKSIVINSGYRSPYINKLVGGAATSQHKTGQAADIRCNNRETREWIFNYIKNNLIFDQLILEHNKSGVYWVHVSFRKDGRNRKQVIGNLLKK